MTWEKDEKLSSTIYNLHETLQAIPAYGVPPIETECPANIPSCIRCGELLRLSDFPVCGNCGFVLAGPLRSGNYMVVKTLRTDHEMLARFVKDRLAPARPEIFSSKRRVVLSGVDEVLAKLVKDRAADAGIELKARQPFPMRAAFSCCGGDYNLSGIPRRGYVQLGVPVTGRAGNRHPIMGAIRI